MKMLLYGTRGDEPEVFWQGLFQIYFKPNYIYNLVHIDDMEHIFYDLSC